MAREVTSGIVKKIETIDDCISMVTVMPVADESWVETTVPVYMAVADTYMGKMVDIINETKGFLGTQFKQTIASGKKMQSIEISTRYLNMIKEQYREQMEE